MTALPLASPARRCRPTTGCLLAGGAAAVIGPWLTVPYQLREDLVLIGLETIAASRSASSLPKTSS